MSPLPTFGPEWFRIPPSNPLSRHMPHPLTMPQPVPPVPTTRPVPATPCVLAPMAPMAWSPPRTSLAPLAPLPPSTPMMVRRVVTVSPVKVLPPTFVSGAVPAPPVYGMPLTRTVRYAGWDWGNQIWVWKKLGSSEEGGISPFSMPQHNQTTYKVAEWPRL